MDAAGCHGALSGMLCVNRRLRLDEWLADIFGDGHYPLNEQEQGPFAVLFDRTRQELDAFEFDFDLLLPDDDVALAERVVALSHWCKGFLQGLGTLSEGMICGDDGKEVLRDIYQIADLQTQGVSDEDEDAYFELAEYLRVGVQLLRSEFRPAADVKRLH